MTHLKNQFLQLKQQKSFNVIDLKEYCIQRGIVSRKESGALDFLITKTLQKYLPNDEALRKNEEWETKKLQAELESYAALDVFASRLIFEKASQVSPLARVKRDTPPGTSIILLVQEGGSPAAYGKISLIQPDKLGAVCVKTPNQN